MTAVQLQTMLKNQIDSYFVEDNPYPKASDSFFTKVASLFSTSGREGRRRAEAYRAIIAENDISVKLIDRVFEDAADYSDTSPLGNSTKLRLRLLNALCQYLNVSKSAIDFEMGRRVRLYTFNKQTAPVWDVNYIQVQSILKLILHRIQSSREMQSLAEPQDSLLRNAGR